MLTPDRPVTIGTNYSNFKFKTKKSEISIPKWQNLVRILSFHFSFEMKDEANCFNHTFMHEV